MELSANAYSHNLNNINKQALWRLTILWAFTEATLGGILHAMHIPFTGLFNGSLAVIFISLISYYSKEKKTIINSTIIVILVKAFVSPYTPLTAYFSVFIEGLMGYILFSFLSYRIAAISLGLLALLFSGIQKIIILTVVFGLTLWESINIFVNYVVAQFMLSGSLSQNIDYSFYLIILYLILHTVGGIAAGVLAAKLPKKISNKIIDINGFEKFTFTELEKRKGKKRKRKILFFKSSGILFLVFAGAMIIVSLTDDSLDSNIAFHVAMMIVRSVFIVLFWALIVYPLLKRYFDRFLKKEKLKFSKEMNEAIALFPQLKSIVYFSWSESKKESGKIRRMTEFITYSLSLVISSNFNKTKI
ncbi:MAG: hypothetical protein GXO87_04030 [Chlorobi bacterium]|nr:hypothetical protein [Chlorobiota bacterium]